jgi:hypothetical protein
VSLTTYTKYALSSLRQQKTMMAWINIVVNAQGHNPRNNHKKEKEKIYVLAEEWRIIMSAINHGTGIPADSRR